MAGRFSSLLCIALYFHVASELYIEVSSQTTETTDNTTSTASPAVSPKQIVTLELIFQLDFNETYRDNSSSDYQAMFTGFNTTFSTTLYQDNVLSFTIDDVKNGSVIVRLTVNLKEFVNETNLWEQLGNYTESCKMNTTTNTTTINNDSCFDFGPLSNATILSTQDERCESFSCPNNTYCETDSVSGPYCVCPPGYNMTNTTSSNDTSGGVQCEAVPMTCYANEEEICLRNLTDNSTVSCDPCFGSPISCNETQICVASDTCAPVCGCPNNTKEIDGKCLDACAVLSPCQNGGNCSADEFSFNYTCTCPPEYSGTNCSQGTTDSTTVSASTASPDLSPKQIIELELRFELDFNDSYLNRSSSAYQDMFTGFNTTFSTKLYQDNVLSFTIDDVKNGSIIAKLTVILKELVNDTRLQLDNYIDLCKTNMTTTCFGFGPPPNVTSFDAEELPMICYANAEKICLRNSTDNSTVSCDPCLGYSSTFCNETQICVASDTCAPVCRCPNNTKEINGKCLDACAVLSPCQHGGNCSADEFSFNYTCTCPPEYSGTNCSKDVDECDSVTRPAKCPLNNYFCQNIDPGYNCACQTGYVLNEANGCDKVNQIFKTIIVLDYEYRANFKNKSSEQFKELLNNFTQTFEVIFGNGSILSVEIPTIKEGSIIVSLTLNFKDYASNRSNLLDQYIKIDCANGSRCFNLGPFVKKTDVDNKDTRCDGVLCPANTKCQIYDDDVLSCLCDVPGFKLTGDIGESGYGPVKKLESCQDIDECGQSNACKENELCTNTVGSYQCSCPYILSNGACTPPCKSNPCGTNGECEKIDNFSYRCNCNWTRTGPNCESALPLTFMILMCIFIVLFIVAVGVAIYCFKQAQKDKLAVSDMRPMVGSTAAWRSTEL